MQRSAPALAGVPVWRSMLVFLAPLIASNVLQSASATLNSIYLGRLLGVRALAAASSFFPIVFFMIAFFIGIASGSSVLIGQAHGARDERRVRDVAGTTVTVALAAGIVIGAAGYVFAVSLLQAIGTPPDVFGAALAYARVTFLSLPVLFVYLAYTTFVRGVGDSRMPFLALIVSTILTMILTPAFIRGWFGLPQSGVAGAGYANLAANALALAVLLFMLRAERSPLAPSRAFLPSLRLRPRLLATLARIGIPTGIQLVMVSLAEIAVISLVNRSGSSATAAYGAVNQIVSYVQFPAISIGIAASIFGAHAIGGGRHERLNAIVRAGLTLNLIVGAALIALVYAFNRSILGLFVTDPKVIDVAHGLLAITLWSYVVFGTSSVLSGIMRSSGSVLVPTAISVASIWAVEVPVAYALAPHLGLPGIWTAYPVAFVSGMLGQAAYFWFVWRRSRLVPLLAV